MSDEITSRKLVTNRFMQRVVDLVVLSAAYWLATLIRFDGDPPFQMFKRMLFLWPYVVGFQYLVLLAFGIPKFSWRYVSLRDSWQILIATGAAASTLLVVRILAAALKSFHPYAEYALIPIGIIIIDAVLVFAGIAGIRGVRRMAAERAASGRRRGVKQVRTMLVGAGDGGLTVAKEAANRPDMGIKAVGFLDDEPSKIGTVLYGIPVLGSTERLAELCERHQAEQVLVTIAHAQGSDVRRIVNLCDAAGLPVKIIPGLHEIVGGQVNLSAIRDVAIEDLLRRDPVELDTKDIADFVQDKVVLVTGAGGSIGSELCRQVSRFAPSRLLLVERFENALFEINRELARIAPGVDVHPFVADVGDAARMDQLFREMRPEVVFHAAAHKHVPMMELNPGEAIKNNVLGTKQVADLAHKYASNSFILISTDKAVNPTSVMGATKRVAELYVQTMEARSDTKFVAVRFGNVLGSNGSVIPVFQEQIEAGGPVTVTHPEMRRYFMTIPEASQLVLEAAALGAGGEVFILDMGQPVRIVDLACDLIRLSGLEPHRDIEIEYTGIRPGEKLFEELATDEERADKTRHEKIFVGRVKTGDWHTVLAGIESLSQLSEQSNHKRIYDALREIIPEFSGYTAAVSDVIPLAPRS